MSVTELPGPNPYVGPRAFKYGETLHAREREVTELLDLLIAERIVLLYSPSGAGKTSLIQAALIPRLEQEGFRVLPVIRVAPGPLANDRREQMPNRHLFSALTSLEAPFAEERRGAVEPLRSLSLAHYLEQVTSATNGGSVLVFDQFEEILTTGESSDVERRGFFTEVGAALHDKGRWALFAMREEYLAGLDPFLRPVPTRFKSRYRLTPLRAAEARRAIQQPARDAGVDFTDAAATALVDDLRRVTVQRPDGTADTVLGDFVEPVQLQVVCHRLWARLGQAHRRIDVDDVRELHDVNTALADYYAERVHAVALETGTSERIIRDWFEEELITRENIRRLVMLESQASPGFDRVVGALVDAHLVRPEKRPGATYYELSHDRLIGPVRTDNARWREEHLSLLQRQAALWERERRPDGLLLTGHTLEEAVRWSEAQAGEVNATERAFLAASLKAVERARRDYRRNRVIRVLSLALLVLLVGVSYYAYTLWLEVRPWGYLRNLSTGTLHALRGALVSVGRTSGDVEAGVHLAYRDVSRLHFFVYRDHTALDMRSLYGTVINGGFLPYGDSRKLEDGDLIVLADIAPFEYRTITYGPLQLRAPRPAAPPPVPDRAWSVLIDDGTRRYHYLSEDTYFLGVDAGNALVVSTRRDAVSPRLILRRHGEGFWRFQDARGREEQIRLFTIEDVDDDLLLWAVLKTGDYTYRACLVPSTGEWHTYEWKRMRCQTVLSREDMDEDQHTLHRVFAASYHYPAQKVRFRIVPVLRGLESAAPR